MQERLLAGVSETFARTIPELPQPLRAAMTNFYMLLKVADVVEDSPVLEPERKRRLLGQYVEVVDGHARPEAFTHALLPAISEGATVAELDLVANTGTLLAITNGLGDTSRDAIKRCARVTSGAMAEFCDTGPSGLASMGELDRYCYLTSGVAGETITDLLCDYSIAIARRREPMYDLSRDFGRAVQLVNILRDRWEDRERGVCWLPRDVFGGGPDPLSDVSAREFQEAVLGLTRLARRYLAAALDFTLMIPRHETGVRRFLLWSLGAMLVVARRIAANPGFRSVDEVSVHRDIRAVVAASSLAVRSDRALRWMFDVAVRSL
ncbi:MAG: squalene/phytoene synthase family protein [Gammaproteobacteria bacterium]|nr:squalene/phytoene synthase family protein [Gammaproteobacteria bacterium]